MNPWAWLALAMTCEAFLLSYVVAKFAYRRGFDHGWICGGTHTLDIARNRGFDQAEYVLTGMRKALDVDLDFDPGRPTK